MNKEATTYYQQAGVEAALVSMGLQKEAFLPAAMAVGRGVLAAGRVAAPLLGRTGATALRGLGRSARAGGQAFAQQAPGAARALGTAKKVLTNPWTQAAMVGGSMVS